MQVICPSEELLEDSTKTCAKPEPWVDPLVEEVRANRDAIAARYGYDIDKIAAAFVDLSVPKGVVCLISALAYHDLTTQIPHEVYLAMPRGTEPPRLTHPPVRTFWFVGRAFTSGIESHRVDGVAVRVYGPEKTLADCFKYRNKIGLDTTLEALRLYKERSRPDIDALLRYAAVCRVTKTMRPYLEAIL